MGDFKKDTINAWNDYLHYEIGIIPEEIRTYLDFEQACSLCQILKMCEDERSIFPYGKWASIQYLEDKLNHTILDEFIFLGRKNAKN